MARRTSTSSTGPNPPASPGKTGGSSTRSPAAARPLNAADQRFFDRNRIHALAERFAVGWSTNPPANDAPVPDGRRAAAADPAEAPVTASPETVKRLNQAIQEIIDWIAMGIWMLRIPGAHDRRRLWPDLKHEAHLAKRAGLSRKEWDRLVKLLGGEASLPIVGRFVPESPGAAAHWSPEEASLSAWSKGWNWEIVIAHAKSA